MNKVLTHKAPFVTSKLRVSGVMLDVIITLLPLVFFSYLAHGKYSMMVIGTAVGSALITDWLVSWFFLKKPNSPLDGSAIITATLMAFTLSPYTPLYMVAFGGAMAVLFGKTLWGGVGKNRFNPALVGREFMVAFFPVVMTSASVWMAGTYTVVRGLHPFSVFGQGEIINYLNSIFYNTNGALGEYSIVFLALAGIYLVARRRIGWQIPTGLLVTFFALSLWFEDSISNYSIAGVLLGAIFMATDMPSSPNSNSGKLFYGIMIGAVAIICLAGGVKHEYMSYSILVLNGFSTKINEVFIPRTWGRKTDLPLRIKQTVLLILQIVAVSMAVLGLNYYGYIHYLVFVYLAYMIFNFHFFTQKKLQDPI
ncbi:MAG: electron transporter [Crocinitomicaceae bacterium]|nr:electron transporter [Crocinitomicaceae bacterium]|tara:strand:- start:466 stop:1563 length:1098 start_codon:yes stop_codon:yes gene_type:complete